MGNTLRAISLSFLLAVPAFAIQETPQRQPSPQPTSALPQEKAQPQTAAQATPEASKPQYNASGSWTVQFGDSQQSGTLTLDLKESTSGHISGTYSSSLGGNGIVDGTRDGETLELNLAQTTKDCPGTFTGKVHFSDANSGSGQFSGKDCSGEHANGVVLLTRSETQSTSTQIAASPTDPGQTVDAKNPPTVSSEIVAERENLRTRCPSCAGVMIAYVDAQTGSVTYDWATKHQIDWIHKQSDDIKEGKRTANFLFVKNRENAHYIIYWTQAVGYRPYVMYIPHTTTDTGTFSGSYNGSYSSYSTNGTNVHGTSYGNFDGTVSVTRTDYQRFQGQRAFVNVTATVYDWRGKKLYQTFHQGNFRWSKPDKDCLTDAIEYLRKNLPEAPK
jgi:hypothetical protein